MKLVTIILFTIFYNIVCGAPIIPLNPRSLPIKPSEDPFYSAPDGFESKSPGDVLRHRQMNNLFGVLVIPEKIKSIHQFLIRSEDSFGDPIAAVTTVFEPYNADPNKLLSYQAAEDAANIDCSPSYAMQLGADADTILTSQIEQLLAQAGLNEGWYVVIPDHQGPKSTFVVGESAGHIVLDSIRATLGSGNITGINEDAKVVLWGYSGGSFASGWAAQMHPTYASELDIVGAAYGGIVANISQVAEKNFGGAFTGFVMAAINGLANEYPELDNLINEIGYKDKLDKFRKAKQMCLIEELPYYAFDQVSEYVDGDKQYLLTLPIVKNITEINTMIGSKYLPTIPLYFYQGKGDEIIPASGTDELYEDFCERGADIEYHEDLLSEHLIQAVAGAGGAFNWMKDRLNGKSSNQGCKKISTASNAITHEGLSGLGEVFAGAILTLLQKPVGPYEDVL